MTTETEIAKKRKEYRDKRLENITTQEIFDSLQSDPELEARFLQGARNGNFFAMGAAAYAAMIADINLFAEEDVQDWLKEEPTQEQLTREEIHYDDQKQAGAL